jgi:hypothetical protein
MRKKWIQRIGCGLIVSGALVACDEWPFWDDMFKRNSIGANRRGWTGGDGAFSAALPNNREFWIFGDTLVTNWTAQGTRDPFPGVKGHSIAVQNDRVNPSASGINFFARSMTNPNQVINITNMSNAGNSEFRQFFTHAMLGLTEPSVPRYLWPVASECLNCDNPTNARLLVSFHEWEACPPATGCDELGHKRTGNIIARFKDLANAPDGTPGWSRDGTALYIPRSGNQIEWGVAFLKDTDNNVYIYAHQPDVSRLFVAKATEATVLNGGWPAWRTNASGAGVWSSDGALSIRPVAEQVPLGPISVDRVTRNGISSYVLVHSKAAVDTHVYVRTNPTNSVNGANTAAAWDTVPGTTTPRIDVSTIDSSLSSYKQSLIDTNKCDAIFTGSSLAPDYKVKCPPPPQACPVPRVACGWGYHGKAHYETASNDGSGTALIPVSYIVPFGVNGTQNTAYYRPKFTAIDVSALKPWCSGTNCWEGIVKEWPRRTVGSGGSVSYLIDMQAATKLWANVARLAGTPTLQIEWYNGLSSLGTTNCGVSGSNVTCNNVTKLPNTSWAVIRVNGAATDQFVLRVHHAGNY